MNQAEAWLKSRLGRWHHGTYPDMDTPTASFHFGGDSSDPNYTVLRDCRTNRLTESRRSRDEVLVHMLCKNIVTLSAELPVLSATHYEEV